MKYYTMNVIHHDGILTGLTVKTATIYFTLLGKTVSLSIWLYPMKYDRAEGLWVRGLVESCKRMEREEE